MKNSEQFVSLFEYLGRPAGSALGKQVAEAATANKIPMQTRQITTKTYSGQVMLYPENWLIGYFSTGQSNFNTLIL